MATKAYNLFFPESLVKEPIMFLSAKKNNLILNVLRAKMTEKAGYATVQLVGEDKDIEKAIKEMETKGVKVEPTVGDIVE